MKLLRQFLFTQIFCAALFSCKKQSTVPVQASPESGVYYSLFVRSFADSNSDGIGDFNGITAKLDYLQELGITGIWLLPIFPSHSYHGYDIDDYYNVNPEYGTMADFAHLVSECNLRGISVIIDMPLNHSSVYNNFFISSIQKESKTHDWYRWTDFSNKEINLSSSIWKHRVWNSIDSLKELYGGIMPVSDYDADLYYSGLYSPKMPDFNHDNKELREEFKNILRFWLSKGVAGFRFDAAGNIYNTAKLPSNDRTGQKRAKAFWREITNYVKSIKSDAFLVGEVWENTGTRADYMSSLPSTFHFDIGPQIIDAVKNQSAPNNALAKRIYNDLCQYADKNPEYIDAPFLTNHDQNRFALQLKNNPDMIKLASSMYIFQEGVPFIYYGEEIAMNGAKPDEQIRTPFIWDAQGKDAMQASWIESKYNKNTVPQKMQESDKNSILSYYKKIIHLKTSCPALRYGRLTPFNTSNMEIISWKMSAPGTAGKNGESLAEKCDTVYVFFNVTDKEQEVSLIEEDGGANNAKSNAEKLMEKSAEGGVIKSAGDASEKKAKSAAVKGKIIFASKRGARINAGELKIPPVSAAVIFIQP